MKKRASSLQRKSKQLKALDEEKIEGYPVFRYDMLDRNGPYAFDLSRQDFDHHLVLEKIIAYSCMKWTEIQMQTHDHGKSKHHPLTDASRLSDAARERLHEMQKEDLVERLFSFALTNKLRLIGFRFGDDFHVLWYDANHEVYPPKK